MIRSLKKNISKTMLCAGIDPDISKIPKLKFLGNNIKFFLKKYVDSTIDFVCCYKIQKAFFDNIKSGDKYLKFIINYIHEKNKNIPVIMDCKIGDIENTMIAYLNKIFNVLKADGIVINPYMGKDVLDFAKIYPDKIFAVLVKTSNEGSDIIQNISTKNNDKLWLYILKLILKEFNQENNIVPILARLSDKDINLQNILSEEDIVLFAGTGSQNGDLQELNKIFNKEKNNVFFNVSRKIMYPVVENKKYYFKEVEKAAKEYMHFSNEIRR